MKSLRRSPTAQGERGKTGFREIKENAWGFRVKLDSIVACECVLRIEWKWTRGDHNGRKYDSDVCRSGYIRVVNDFRIKRHS